ncbi:MAG: ABC transporter permease, partial [Bacteroidia bacterium]
LIILILDRTNMIGLLKALGAQNTSVMRIFLMHAVRLIVKGVLIGNAAGLLLCWLQDQFEILRLDQASYYVDAVPVDLVWWHVIALNAAALILCMFALYIPARIITRVSPVRAIRYN